MSRWLSNNSVNKFALLVTSNAETVPGSFKQAAVVLFYYLAYISVLPKYLAVCHILCDGL